MSEGIEAATWHGIPLSDVRMAYFRDAANTYYSLRKLRVNNRTLTFNDQNDGYVKMDGTYTNWLFGCPLGAFSAADFEGATVAGFFDAIIAYTSSRTVKAWETFASFLGGNTSMINNILALCETGAVSVLGTNYIYPLDAVPRMTSISNFTDLVRWIKGTLPDDLLAEAADIMQAPADGGSYCYGVTMEMTTSIDELENVAMTFSFVL